VVCLLGIFTPALIEVVGQAFRERSLQMESPTPQVEIDQIR
jgi:hypothetical protein